MTSSSNQKPHKYAELVDHKLLEHENLYELTFNEIRFFECSYFTHRKRQRHSTMYVIPCEYTSNNQVLINLFNDEDVDLLIGTIIHHYHKVYDNYHEKIILSTTEDVKYV